MAQDVVKIDSSNMDAAQYNDREKCESIALILFLKMSVQRIILSPYSGVQIIFHLMCVTMTEQNDARERIKYIQNVYEENN